MKKSARILISLIAILCAGIRASAENDDFSRISRSVQSFQTEPFLGASSTSIPVSVPPGRKGLQPQINIGYSSAAGNGWLGVGWSLDFGYIERRTNKGIPKYDTSDIYCVSFGGINSDLETAGNMPDEYYPKTTSRVVKFLFKGAYWEACDKEGTKYIFGSTADSRIDTPKGTFRWELDKIIDTCGNYLSITYIKDQGQTYPLKIEYAGNEAVPEPARHKVEFVLEDREDEFRSYRSGTGITTAKRLKEIRTYAGASLAGRYLFEYAYSRQTGRLLLARSTRFGSDGLTSLPPMVFDYYDSSAPAYNIVRTDAQSGNKLWYIQKGFGFWQPGSTGALYPKHGPTGCPEFEGGAVALFGLVEDLASSGDYWSIDQKGKLTVSLPKRRRVIPV